MHDEGDEYRLPGGAIGDTIGEDVRGAVFAGRLHFGMGMSVGFSQLSKVMHRQ